MQVMVCPNKKFFLVCIFFRIHPKCGIIRIKKSLYLETFHVVMDAADAMTKISKKISLRFWDLVENAHRAHFCKSHIKKLNISCLVLLNKLQRCR